MPYWALTLGGSLRQPRILASAPLYVSLPSLAGLPDGPVTTAMTTHNPIAAHAATAGSPMHTALLPAMLA